MITVKLMGGLCNQMFQYAYGLALKERGHDVQYDRSALIEGTHREYSLGYFGIEAGGRGIGPNIYEDSIKYNSVNLSLYEPCTMIGYWQSEKYFANIADKVRDEFKFPGVPVRYAQTIAIHVRRKDYVGLQHFHGMPTLDYYREAVAYIRRKVGFNCYVMVFSDDPQWCFENFPSDFQIVNGQSKYDDLRLISLCDYQVIANSSFSWWGAWLGPQKLVVAPKQWFADSSVDAADIVPERWVKL